MKRDTYGYDTAEELGMVIREERKRHRITQAKLGEMAGLSRNVIANYETGRRFPSQTDLQKIEKYLCVRISRRPGMKRDFTGSV